MALRKTPWPGPEQKAHHLSRGAGVRRRISFRTPKSRQRFADQVEAPPDLAMPQTPAYLIDGFDQRDAGLAIVRQGVRPAFNRLINMLNPHRKVEPVKQARQTLTGIEKTAMIRKGQIRNILGNDMRAQRSFIAGLFQLAA
jgi:hypothetical protein